MRRVCPRHRPVLVLQVGQTEGAHLRGPLRGTRVCRAPKDGGAKYLVEVIDNGALGISGTKRHQQILAKLMPSLCGTSCCGANSKAAPRRCLRGSLCRLTGSVWPWEWSIPRLLKLPSGYGALLAPHWCTKADFQPRLLWTDTGTSGQPGSIWQVNSIGMTHVQDNHDPPTVPFYELRTEAWLVGSDMSMIQDYSRR